MTNNISNEKLIHEWYLHVAEQKGFIGTWLRLLRERQQTTPEQQQNDFGVSNQGFIRLQGMPLPRPTQFTKDAQRIAEACKLKNPSALVTALLLARNIEREGSMPERAESASQLAYQAAYDADEELDKPIDEEPSA